MQEEINNDIIEEQVNTIPEIQNNNINEQT